MRYFPYLFSLLHTFSSLAQGVNSEKNSPFQVLYSENTKNKAGLTLKSLDLVSIDDALTISEGGTLSLIHYSGFPIEINEDTTIIIKDLQGLIEVPGKGKKNKNTYSGFIDLNHLFITDSKLARKFGLGSTGACFDCVSGLEIIYPPNFSMSSLTFKDDLCMIWMPSTSKSCRIEIKTMFEESLDTITLSNNKLHLDNQDLKKIRGDEVQMFVFIQDLENKNLSQHIALKKFQLNSLEFPYPCTIKKATFALMAGLYIERLPQKYFDEAEKYFLLATELSDKPFYKEMLANFKQRTER